MVSLAGLVEPPDQAGLLLKQGHSSSSWRQRFFILKGSNLFYFKGRRDAYRKGFKIHGFIPLENAKIETELPSSPDKRKSSKSHLITITLHSSVALSTKHAFYALAAPSAEVRDAWVNAMWQAAIPRADLVQHLQGAGKLADVLASYAHNVQACFPVADAAVLSTGGRARTHVVTNVGDVAAAIRRHRPAAALDDLSQLPVVASDPKQPASVLARTASGALVSAPSSSVLPPAEGEELVRRAASASGAIAGGGAPFRTRTPTPDSPHSSASPGASKLRPAGAGQVAVSAAAGPAAAAALQGGAGAGAGSSPREADKARQMREIQAQIEQLERSARQQR